MSPGIEAEALGGIAGQAAVAELRKAGVEADLLWLRVCELAGRHGWKSPALRAFVNELGKAIRDGLHS